MLPLQGKDLIPRDLPRHVWTPGVLGTLFLRGFCMQWDMLTCSQGVCLALGHILAAPVLRGVFSFPRGPGIVLICHHPSHPHPNIHLVLQTVAQKLPCYYFPLK